LNQTVLTKNMLFNEVIKDLGINTIEQEVEVTTILADVVTSANKLDLVFNKIRKSKRSKGKLEG